MRPKDLNIIFLILFLWNYFMIQSHS